MTGKRECSWKKEVEYKGWQVENVYPYNSLVKDR